MNYLRLTPNAKTPDVLKGKSINSASTDDQSEVERWISQGFNIGLRLAGITVVDFDNKEAAREFWKKHRDLCTVTVETRRGLHAHFSGQTQGRKFDSGDIKTGPNSYVIIPPSVVDGWKYRHVTNGELLPFPAELFPIVESTRTALQAIDEDDPVRRVIRARAWLAKRDKKEDGNGRGLQTIKTCRALFRMFQLTEEQVWPLILEYNERCCIPPYSENQLRHKILDSQKGA